MQEGVTIQGVQKAICDGLPYGRKEYTATEREAACKSYEEMTGTTAPQSKSDYTIYIAGAVAASILLLAIVWYIFYKRTADNKLRRKTKNSKPIS